MLEKLDLLYLDTMNIVVYVKSEILKTIIKDAIKARFEIKKNVSLVARTDTELKEIKHSTIVEPFGGGTWFVEVETEDISIRELRSAIDNTYNSSLTVYWVENYGTYKRIQEFDETKRQGIYTQQFYSGRLDDNDIYYIQIKMLKDKSMHLPDKLMKYLVKNYTYDVEALCDLYVELRNGLKVKSTKDIISAVGLGGNTIDSFAVKLLTSNPKTDKGLDKIIGDSLTLLKDLNYNYDFITIRRFMISTVDTMIEIKQLQILGKFSRAIQEIPIGYNEFKIKRLRRFYGAILEEITLARLLNLKLFLYSEDLYNVEISLINSIMLYLQSVKDSFEKHPDKQVDTVKRKWKSKG